MRMRLRTAAVLAIAGTIVVGVVAPAAADTPTDPTWSVDLAAGQPAGVTVVDGTARLAGQGAFRAPAGDGAEGGADGTGPLLPTGLLTFPARTLPTPTDRVGTRIDGGDGTGSTVDVRGMRANGNWSEWIPAAGDGTVTLPEDATQVQSRLVLTDATAAVHGVALSALPARAQGEGTPDTEAAPISYKVFATREGLEGGTTANGHVIGERDHFVALPSRRALSANDTSDYSVKVCAPNGKCAFAPVWDIGPWNTHDDYWNAPADREQWTDLPQGMPQAQAAFDNQYNGGKDQFDRSVLNPAGIDLGDGVFWDALGLTDNSFVTVDYLWTGSVRLSKVVGDAPAKVLAAPDTAAQVVGSAAEDAEVPVQCRLTSALGSFLQIGVGQFLDAAAVPDVAGIATCPPGGQQAPSVGAPPVGTAQSGAGPAGTGPLGTGQLAAQAGAGAAHAGSGADHGQDGVPGSIPNDIKPMIGDDGAAGPHDGAAHDGAAQDSAAQDSAAHDGDTPETGADAHPSGDPDPAHPAAPGAEPSPTPDGPAAQPPAPSDDQGRKIAG